MAKDSNNARIKKSHSSKPYDVASSFAKKVASRVTSLMPQPSWLSRWFNEDETSDDNQIEHASEHTSNKRPRIDLSRSFPASKFVVAPASASQAGVEDERYSLQRGSVEPVAGPSGLNKSPNLNTATLTPIENELVDFPVDRRNIGPRPSLSTYLNQSAISSTNVDRRINGDDVSESSESTSGCSSLPQQVTQHTLPGENRPSNAKRSFDGTTLMQGRRSLLLSRTHSPRVNTPLSRRRTLFNISAFGSPNMASDSSLSKSSVINSPFYTGRTAYGGASAYRRSRDFASELYASRRSSIEVQPINNELSKDTSDITAMSQPARRILEALEQFASPVQNAKKMMVESPTFPVLASKQSCIEPVVAENKSRLRQLTIPTVPDIIKLRRREKLQDSLETARLIANSTKDNTYQLRIEDNSRTGKVLGRKTNIEEEETVKEVNLPNISLPITVLPKFDFQVPPQLNLLPVSTCVLKFASPVIVQDTSRTVSSEKTFTFSEPLCVCDNNSEETLVNASKSIPAVTEGPSQSKPHPCVLDKQITASAISAVTSVSEKSHQNSTSFHSVPSDYKINSRSIQFKFADEKKTDSGINKAGPECYPKNDNIIHTGEIFSGNSKNVSFNAPLDNLLKASGDTWECGTCLIRNKLSVSWCIACTSPRKVPETPSSSLHCHNIDQLKMRPFNEVIGGLEETEQQVDLKSHVGLESTKLSHGLSEVSKSTWECATCWIRNPETASKCLACETSKPNDKAQYSALVEKHSRPTETWECPICMIRNKNEVQKCAACEGAKPGSANAATLKSTLKFNVDISAEATKFNFGIDKAQLPVETKSSIKEFKFGEAKVAVVGPGYTHSVGNTACRDLQSTSSDKKAPFTFGVPHSSPTNTRTSLSESNKIAGDNVCHSDSDFKSNIVAKFQESSSDKQVVDGEGLQKSSSGIERQEKVSNSVLEGCVTSISGKQGSDSAVKHFRFPASNNSSVTSSAVSPPDLFTFGGKAKTNVIPSSSSGASTGIMATNGKNVSSESVNLRQSPASIDQEIPQKKEKVASIFGVTCVSTNDSPVAVTAVNNSPGNVEHTSKSAQEIQTVSDLALPIAVPNKTLNSTLPFSTTQKATFAATPAPSVPVSGSHVLSTPSGTVAGIKSAAVTTTAQSIFGRTVAIPSVSAAPTNFNATTTAIQSFGDMTSPSMQLSGVATNTSSSFGTTTASVQSFTSPPVVSSSAFGSTAAVQNFSAPTAAGTNFGTAKPVQSFGAPAASDGSSDTPFANVSAVSTASLGNGVLFVTQKPPPQQSFGSTVSVTSAFNSNSAPNFGASVTNLTGFGTPSTTAPQFGLASPAPAFGMTTPSFGANNAQNFGGGTTSAQGFGTSTSGTFNAKPAIGGSKPSSAASSFVFSANTNSTSLPFPFGASQSNTSDPSGPVAKAPNFNFGAASTSGPAGQSSGFGFGQFGSNSTSGGQAIFGSGASATSAFGSSGNPGFTAPTFFGQNSQANSNMFGFSSNPGAGGAQAAQNTAPPFNFTSSQPAAPPTFNPNVKPSFNFTGGNTPAFTAEASSPTPPAPTQRRIKKAVRRTQTRTNAL